MKKTCIFFCLIVAVAFASNSGYTDVVYQHGPGADGSGAFYSDSASDYHAADMFHLNDPATIRDVHWQGIYTDNTPPALDNFTIQIFHIVAGFM